MKLSNLFGAPRLTPRWSFSTANILWRFLVSEHGLILGEDRDTDAKTVTFFCMDMKTGRVLWSGKSFGESWWIGIEALIGNRLYVHGFAKPDMPEHHGLIAIDAVTGAEAWNNPEISFYAADTGRVIGYRDLFERRIFEQFDAATGASLGELAAVEPGTEEMRRHTFGRTDFTYPEPLTGDDARQELILTALAKHGAARDTQLTVEYAPAGDRLCISAHLPHPAADGSATRLMNVLCVVNSNTGKEEYFDVLNADTPYPVPDSFFIDGGFLYYIKEKRTLTALPLA
jgi:hypothetical protein